MKEITTEAVRFTQSDKTLYVASIRAGDLLEIAEVDVWNPEIDLTNEDGLEKQGYQRKPVDSHLASVARFLNNESDPLLPTSVLISARSGLRFQPTNGGNVGTLSVKEKDLPLYVVDGQHRLFGIKTAYERHGREDLLDFCLPVTILQGVTKIEEIEQFYVVNTTAKRIRTDLASRLLLELSEQDEELQKQLVGKNMKWRLRATKITTMLNERPDSPWESMIKAPNTSGRSEAIATETSVATSLKPILDGPFTERLDDEKVAKLIQRLWSAIEELMPEAFDNPKDYVLQKTPGVYTIHMVAPRIFELCNAKNDFSLEGMKDILTGTEEAADYFATEQFWRSRSGGGEAAMYNSMGAFRQLADEIEKSLPELTVDIAI